MDRGALVGFAERTMSFANVLIRLLYPASGNAGVAAGVVLGETVDGRTQPQPRANRRLRQECCDATGLLAVDVVSRLARNVMASRLSIVSIAVVQEMRLHLAT